MYSGHVFDAGCVFATSGCARERLDIICLSQHLVQTLTSNGIDVAVCHLLLHQNWTPVRPVTLDPNPRKNIPKCVRPWAWPGSGRAGGRLVFCIYLGYVLDIFGYMFAPLRVGPRNA